MDLKLTEKKKTLFGFYFGLVALGIAIDQVIKLAVRSPFRNYDFAFSISLPLPVIYTIYFLVLVAVIIFIVKQNSRLDNTQRFAWSLVLAGALSNVGERIVLGYVRDYLYIFGGILNAADFMIIVGILLLLSGELFPGLQERFRK
jgi:lipoprotein signal peptidase